MTEIVLVKCRDYNGRKNCLFVMCSNDSRIGDGDYTFVTNGHFGMNGNRSRFFAANRKAYQVFADLSAKAI
jgi:hypothetical protein